MFQFHLCHMASVTEGRGQWALGKPRIPGTNVVNK